MSAVTADYDECTCIGGRCMRKEQSYASAFFTFWLVTVKVEIYDMYPLDFKEFVRAAGVKNDVILMLEGHFKKS